MLLLLELNISTGRRGKKADEYCMIRGRERDGAVAALLMAERQTHAHAPRRCSQHQQTSLQPLFPSPYPASQQHVPTLCAADRGSPDTEALGFFFWGVRKCFLLFPTPNPRLGSLPGEVRYVSSSALLPRRCPIPMQSSYHVVKGAPVPWPGSVAAAAGAWPLLTHQTACQAGRAASPLPRARAVRAAGAFPRPASMLMTRATRCCTAAPALLRQHNESLP